MIFQATSDDIARCTKFAEQVVGTNVDEYSRRGQKNKDRIIQQIVEGKIVEVVVARALLLPDPDFEVYGKKKKSFSADMVSPDNIHYHVKSQTKEMGDKYGTSWVFEKRDKLVRKESNPNDKLVLCVLDGILVDIRFIIPADEAVYGNMKLPHLRSKCAIYEESLLRSKYVR